MEQIGHLLPKKIQPHIQHSSQYAFFIFQKLRESLDAGDIHFQGSTRFKSFEEDLVTAEALTTCQRFIHTLQISHKSSVVFRTYIAERVADLMNHTQL